MERPICPLEGSWDLINCSVKKMKSPPPSPPALRFLSTIRYMAFGEYKKKESKSTSNLEKERKRKSYSPLERAEGRFIRLSTERKEKDRKN
jgi:hypothetical protein